MADITLDNKTATTASIRVQLTPEDYKPTFDKTIADYRRNMQMKGFRKGKVPRSIILKMHGNNVLANTLNDMLSEKVQNFINDEELQIIGSPIPEEGQTFAVDVKNMDDFSFSYQIGLEPEVDTSFLDKLGPFDREVIEVSDELIDEEVERLQKRFGTQVEREKIDKKAKDEVLNVTFNEIDENGELLSDGHTHDTSLMLDMVKDEKIVKKLQGKPTGTAVDVNIFETFDREDADVAKHFLGLDEVPENGNYRLEVNTVKAMEPAALDEEFFKKAYGEDSDITTEEAMREKIKETAADYFNAQADKKLYNTIVETAIDSADLSFDDEFLKRWIRLTNEKPITKEQVEEEYPTFKKQLTWNIITKYIIREEELEVSQEEIEESTRKQLIVQLQQYGMGQLGPEEMNGFVQSMLAREDHVRETRQQVMEQKVMDVLLKRVNHNDKSVTIEDFNNEAKAEA